MPESASALWRMVSLTAAKTSRMFEVSVACVRLQYRHVSEIVVKVASTEQASESMLHPHTASIGLRYQLGHCHAGSLPRTRPHKEKSVLTVGTNSNAPY